MKVGLTRQARFSSGHRFWNENRTESENKSQFGKWASPFNHGHNYLLEVTVEGETDRRSGMVINIKDLDKLIQKQIVDAFGQKSLNDEVAEFQGQLPCLENLIFVLKDRLCGANNEILITDHVGQTKSVKLTKLKCYEMEDLWAEWTNKEMTITRSYEFAAAHRLYIASMSNEENDRIFGKCNNPNGHGHNYVVEVTIGGKPDPVTGMILNLEEIDCIVERDLLAVLDHKNLNMDVSELSDVPTTTENLTLYVFEKLHQSFGDKLRKVRVLETARSAFEVSAT